MKPYILHGCICLCKNSNLNFNILLYTLQFFLSKKRNYQCAGIDLLIIVFFFGGSKHKLSPANSKQSATEGNVEINKNFISRKHENPSDNSNCK